METKPEFNNVIISSSVLRLFSFKTPVLDEKTKYIHIV